MILYIDMDDTIAGFTTKINELYPEVDTTQWLTEETVNRICKENPHIFYELEPLPGAIEAVHRLFENPRFDIYFLSQPMWGLPESYTDKRLWIDKYVGDSACKRLILTHNKGLQIGSFLVDDHHKNGEQFMGKFIHFGTPRFPSWKTVLYYLENEI